MNKILKIDHRYYVSILLIIVSVLFYFKFDNCFLRLYYSFKDLINSIWFYIVEIFELPFNTDISVNEIPSFMQDLKISFLPHDWEFFKIKMGIYFKSLINFETILFYLTDVKLFFKTFYRILLFVLPLILVLYNVYSGMFSLKKNKIVNQNSLGIIMYKKIEKKFFEPILDWLISVYYFILDRKYIYYILLIIWALYFNLFAIAIEFVAYYFYLIISFDILHLYVQFYKLLLDLMPMINFVPSFLWIIMFLILFNRYRKKIGLSKLNHYEMRNRGVINSMGQVTMICGTMGKGKTKLMTDFVLSQSIMFRGKAKEKLIEKNVMFPHFPFIKFELEIKRAIKYHQIYNLATAELFVRKKNERFFKDDNRKKYFDYNLDEYPYEFNNGLVVVNLFEMLVEYSKLYFIYYIQTSLIVGNYSIREDNVLKDNGFFPIWEDDLFNKSAYEQERTSYFSHIIDFDMVRLGKKIVYNNEFSESLEFGIVDITEGGKERGNALENRGLKKEALVANQNNDLFNLWLKMARHKATIDNFPFIKIFIDEQRPESLGADARELSDKIINIDENEETNNVLMFFKLEWIIFDVIYSIYNKIIVKFRHFRGDNNLFIYLLNKLMGAYYKYYIPLFNTYGFYKSKLSSQKGTMEGGKDTFKYYIMFKKIYSKRYASDAFSEFFRNKALESKYGINDINTYKSERASIEELQSQNSYFIRDLTDKIIDKGEEYENYPFEDFCSTRKR